MMRFVFTLLWIMLSHVLFAQKNVRHSTQTWIQYYNNTKIAERWFYGIDGGYRWRDGNKLMYIARTGILYQLIPDIRIGGGIVTTGNYSNGLLARTELRPYQEIFANMLNKDKYQVTSRFRLEERFFTNQQTDPPTHNFNFRFRYQVSVSIPLLKLSPDGSKKLSLGISDEIFINAGKDIVYNYLDRNRLVIGPAFQVSKSLTLAASYMYQFAQLNLPDSYESDNVLWVTIRHHVNAITAKAKQ